MGEANESRSRKEMVTTNLSLQIDKYPRDLLQRFMSTTTDTRQSQNAAPREEDEDEDEEIELNLGLSLGGRFGVDKNPKKLTRSSSIAGTMPIFRDDDATTPSPMPHPILMRASSLPTETEEEWRKRKEMQSLRRMEAKRRRNEKQRHSVTNAASNNFLSDNKMEVEEEISRESGANMGASFGLPSWPTLVARKAIIGSGRGRLLQGSVQQQQSSQQGSMDSHRGGSSSSISELERKSLQGSSSCEAHSGVSTPALQDRSDQEPSGMKTNESGSRKSQLETDNPSKKSDTKKLVSAESRGKEIGTNAMEEMLSVFTKGDGPDGKRIEGILYKYGKGEEVRIMCVCHGFFLSPAEFVKHGGGSDVAHPLRHILVVNPP